MAETNKQTLNTPEQRALNAANARALLITKARLGRGAPMSPERMAERAKQVRAEVYGTDDPAEQERIAREEAAKWSANDRENARKYRSKVAAEKAAGQVEGK